MATVITYLALFTNTINAHSWARCTHYQAEITGGDYSEDQCLGWIRGWTFDNVDFGQDRGINYQVGVGGGQDLCQRPLSGTADSNYGYANTGKIPRYKVGETVRVVWPAKNHANYECFNNIPDSSMKLYMNPDVNPTADIPNTESTMTAQGYTLVKDWQEGCTAGADGCGFQNCPKFCENTDRATCYGDFVVPTVATAGYYTFVWYWIFNPGSPYTTCYEAYIDTTPATPAPVTGGGGGNGNSTGGGGNFVPSPGSNGVVNGYFTQMPVCITGQEYDATTTANFVWNQFSAVAEQDDIDIIRVDQGTNSYNFTAQISHSSPGAEVTNVAAGFCAAFKGIYAGTDCVNCADTITFALYDDASTGHWRSVSVAFCVSLVLSFCFFCV